MPFPRFHFTILTDNVMDITLTFLLSADPNSMDIFQMEHPKF